MTMGTDATTGPDRTDLLAVALGLSEDQMGDLHDLAGMHGSDPVELVREMVLGGLYLSRPLPPDVEVTVRDFREGSEYLSRLGLP